MKTRVLAGLLAVMLLTSALVLSGCGSKKFDYAKNDLSAYMTVTEESYRKLPVSISVEITELDVSNQILEDLDGLAEDVYASIAKKDQAVAEHDVVTVYYKGVTYDENGVEKTFAGGSNYGSDPATLIVGEGAFIEDLEKGLVGLTPADTAMKLVNEGTVTEEDTVILKITATYKKVDADGEEQTASYLSSDAYILDLKRNGTLAEDIAKQYVGRSLEQVDGNNPMADFKVSLDADGDGKVDEVSVVSEILGKIEATEAKVSVTFPSDYSSTELQGKSAYFYVVLENAITWDAETLQALGFETSETDLYEAYRADVKNTLVEEYAEEQKEDAETYEELVRAAIWEEILAKAEVISYPAGTVDAYIATEKNNLEYAFYASEQAESNQDTYKNLEAFAVATYGSEDWEAVLEENAKTFVKKKLVLYSIAKALDVNSASKAEIKEMKAEIREDYVNYYNQYYSIMNAIYGWGMSAEELKVYAEFDADNAISEINENYFVESVLRDKILDKVYEEYKTSEDLITWQIASATDAE